MNVSSGNSITEVPVWQPDEEVTECALCHESFTFFFRRHHCRKCGRVVCGSCSSKHINYLPRTYVVCPPTQIFLESPHVPHRTCDECSEELEMIRHALEEATTITEDNHHRLLLSNAQQQQQQQQQQQGSGFTTTTVPVDVSRKNSDVRESTYAVQNENDYCPICNARIAELLEIDKLEHITECLEKAQFSGSPEVSRSPNRMIVYRLPKNFTGVSILSPSRRWKPLSRNTNNNNNNKEEDEDGDNGDDAILTAASVDSGGGGIHEQLDNPQKLMSHEIIPEEEEEENNDDYNDDDVGSINECCICLEEFHPNDKVSRLECLCMFHYKCITDWFRRSGPGECPVHAVHS